ncbi:MAG: HmuY family protein [Bacteroidota bacterium]
MYKYFLIIVTLLICWSCIPGENPVQPFDRGGVLSSKVTLGPNYSDQVFFSLDQNKFLNFNDIYIWDLGFACKDSSNYIILNSAKFMKVADLGFKSFDEVSTADLDTITEEQWIYDSPSGNLDSTAIGKWWTVENNKIVSLGKVYIVDRGTNEIGKKLGNVKFRILDYDNKTFKVVYANLKDNISHEYTITKNNDYNYTYLSLEKTGNLLQIEPLKEQWDLVFSKYTELLTANDSNSMWYSVVGAYLNPNGGEAAMLKHAVFDSVNIGALDTLHLLKTRNAIGHDWKFFDLNTSSYIVDPKVVYIIKSVSGFYYKLHFMDFYDDSGNKGTPLFEFQKL